MSVSIIIKRTVNDKETAAKLAPMIIRLRSLAAVQQGFMTDQTFNCLDCDGEHLVITTWHTIEDWNRWMHSDVRREIQSQIDQLLGEKTCYRYYEPVVGGIPPEFRS